MEDMGNTIGLVFECPREGEKRRDILPWMTLCHSLGSVDPGYSSATTAAARRRSQSIDVAVRRDRQQQDANDYDR
jgi:hypothetical protein